MQCASRLCSFLLQAFQPVQNPDLLAAAVQLVANLYSAMNIGYEWLARGTYVAVGMLIQAGATNIPEKQGCIP